MVRSALPQNWLKSSGALLQDFETLGDFTVYAGSTLSADPAHVVTAANSLKILSPAASYGGASWTINQNFNDSDKDIFRLWVYCHDAITITFYFHVSSVTNFMKYMQAYWPNTFLKAGWNVLAFSRKQFTSVSGDSWANNMVRMRVSIYSASVEANVTIDSLYYDRSDIGSVIIDFDDNRKGVYTKAFPYMEARDLKANVYVNPSAAGYDDRFMTLAEMGELYDAGWCLCNHGWTHASFLDMTPAELIASIQQTDDWLHDNGFERGRKYIAYPFGVGYYDATTLATLAQIGPNLVRSTAKGGICGGDAQVDPYEMKSNAMGWPSAYTGYTPYIDQLLYAGLSYPCYIHNIADVHVEGDGDWETSNFQGFINHIVDKRYKCLTWDEWHNGLTNPRYQSLPVGRT